MSDSPTYRTWGRSRGARLPRQAYAAGLPVHVILVTADRQPIFQQQTLACETFEWLRESPETLTACLMPDHLHWLLVDCGRMIREVQRFKSQSTLAARKRGHEGPLWQRSYWDHVVRRQDNLASIARYLLDNPVRAGLVKNASDYPYRFERWHAM